MVKVQVDHPIGNALAEFDARLTFQMGDIGSRHVVNEVHIPGEQGGNTGR